MLEYLTKSHLKGKKFMEVELRLSRLEGLGLHTTILSCKFLCLYCPYTEEILRKEKEEKYIKAVKKEIGLYSNMSQDNGLKIGSFCFGGSISSIIIDSLAETSNHVKEKVVIESEIARG